MGSASAMANMRMATTRTIGPLHLEDLEPHRFEDMVRQLIYDFRNWRTLEATGRAGSDDGFDARAIEIVATGESLGERGEEDEENDQEEIAQDRIWLIQCKREKSINPKKLVGYLNDVSEDVKSSLYGIIFAAACDFSKLSRDAFRAQVRELGYSEAYLWGKAEIEDMLFQPKNDHLLFAYFGVSLQSRRRSLKTELRARLAMKRKALRHLQEQMSVLIRDATDDRYPYLDPDKSKKREERGRWTVLRYRGCFSDGIRFVSSCHFAYLSDNGEQWDFAECMDDGPVHPFQNPWREKDDQDDDSARSAAMQVWDAFPEQNRAWYEMLAVLPYENILDIDEKGDEHRGDPHIYTTEFVSTKGPFKHFLITLEVPSAWGGRHGWPVEEKRIQKFARKKRAAAGRQRLHRKLGASWRQCHRVRHSRVHDVRQSAGAAEGDRAPCDACGRHSQPGANSSGRDVARN
jgi:hypothetical protein